MHFALFISAYLYRICNFLLENPEYPKNERISVLNQHTSILLEANDNEMQASLRT